jgi:DNA-binding protein H-NS
MKPHDFKSMSMEELWSLHEQVTSVLTRKIPAEKDRLEQRLRQLNAGEHTVTKQVTRKRRAVIR